MESHSHHIASMWIIANYLLGVISLNKEKEPDDS